MHWLEQYWYRISPAHLLLWPLSLLFALIAAVRRAAFRAGLLAVTRCPVPVVVVGNISVGGTGKTPVVIWLAQWLQERGFKPGIVCRGYGGSTRGPRRAGIDGDPGSLGDEAIVLARRTLCPVWIGRRRAAAASELLATHPECNVLISDDGLQHYRLARDASLSLIDGERGCGNGMLLPAGPLREPLRHLASVDALVINGAPLFPRDVLPAEIPAFDMSITGRSFYNVLNPQQQTGPEYFAGHRVHAVAAIGNPQRFFNHLRELGISFTAHPFPDHHGYKTTDLQFEEGATIIMTEKDAVKCERFCDERCWVLLVGAEVDPQLGQLVLRKIKRQRSAG
jgi:tetraacyldisaccharide 4'-kinase